MFARPLSHHLLTSLRPGRCASASAAPSVRQVGHFMAFRTPLYNKLLCLFSNIPLVVPVATKFREYHHDHHIFMVRPGEAARGCVLL